jgi:hypothetical protein
MDTRDLTEHEQLVLIGLVKLIVHADQQVSAEEQAMLRTLQKQLGDSTWNERVRQAAEAFSTIPALEAAALQVERREAQRLIHRILEELAGSDEVIPAEAHVLQWIDQTWALSEEEEESEDPIESFVLIDDDDD